LFRELPWHAHCGVKRKKKEGHLEYYNVLILVQMPQYYVVGSLSFDNDGEYKGQGVKMMALFWMLELTI